MQAKRPDRAATPEQHPPPLPQSDDEWKCVLTPEQYRVCRCSDTEQAFTGAYWNHKADGTYLCSCCGSELFGSGAKFDSGTGWPSFWAPSDADRVATQSDDRHGMRRTEVQCSRCGAHLGHLFDDGPTPTGQRYCINSVSLRFVPRP